MKPFNSWPLLYMKTLWRIFAFLVLHSELIDDRSLDLNSWLFICIVAVEKLQILEDQIVILSTLFQEECLGEAVCLLLIL